MEQHPSPVPGKPSFFKKPTPPASAAGGPAAPPRPPEAPPRLVPPPPRIDVPPPPPPLQPPPGPRPPEPPLPGLPAEPAVRRPVFHGRGGTLFGIHIVNVLFTLGTLGVYYFWAKTRTRRFIFSQTAFEGDRFAYHGTGKELLLGTLKAVLVFGVPLVLLRLIRDFLSVPLPFKLAAGLLSVVTAFAFVPVAIVGARRYRLSRTSWRGIRFSFRGTTWELMKIFLKSTILSLLTFNLYYPYFLVRRQAFLISNSYFGNERFDFNGQGRDLLGPFVLTILLSPFTLGLCWVWWVARKRRYLWAHTFFGAARFESTVTAGALLGLYLVNALMLIFSLGLAWPWVKVRNINFAFRYLVLTGPLDVARIQQQAQYASTTGEGLAGFFDTGFDLA